MIDNAKRWKIVTQDYNFVELLNKCDYAFSGNHYSIMTV